MRNILLSLVGLTMLVPVAAVAQPSPPSQCTDVYTSTIEVTGDAQSANGTSGNDFIVVSGDRNSVKGNGGNDCIHSVAGAEANSIKGGIGDDVLVDDGFRNALKGENNDDEIYAGVGVAAALNGGAGIDLCESDASSSEDNCEL